VTAGELTLSLNEVKLMECGGRTIARDQITLCPTRVSLAGMFRHLMKKTIKLLRINLDALSRPWLNLEAIAPPANSRKVGPGRGGPKSGQNASNFR
jgi:hypothetical protein